MRANIAGNILPNGQGKARRIKMLLPPSIERAGKGGDKLGELRDKMSDISKTVMELYVRQVMNKYSKDNNRRIQMRELSDKEKERLRNLYFELEEQVNAFVNQVLNSGEEEAEDRASRTKDMVRKRRE